MITFTLSKHLSEIGVSNDVALEIMTKHAQRMEDFNTMRVGEIKMTDKTLLVFKMDGNSSREVTDRIRESLLEHFGKGRVMLLWGVDLIGAIEKEAQP